MFIIVFYHVFVHVRMFDQVIGTIISGGVGNVMKGVFNLSKAITCLNLLLVPVPDVDPVELLINKKAGTAEVVWNGAF